MPDLFGRSDQVLRGGLSSDAMFVTWPALFNSTLGGDGGVGLLIQQVGVDYRQPIRRIFEIGPGIQVGSRGIADAIDNFVGVPLGPCNPAITRYQPTYYIVGRPEGRLQMQRIVGPNVLQVEFYRTYGNPCTSGGMLISGRAGCSTTDPTCRNMNWHIDGVVLEGVNMNMSAQEMVIQEGINAMFAGLSISTAQVTRIA